MRDLVKKLKTEQGNIFSILSTSVLGSAASFVMMLAFANLVSSHTLGTYQYIVSVVSIIGSITLTGLLTAVVRAVSRKEYFFLTYARRYLYLGSIPAVFIGAAVAGYYAYQANYLLALSVFVSTLFYLGMQILYRFNALYVAIENIKTANNLLKIHALAPLLLVLPALFFFENAYILAILYFLSTFLAFVVGIKIFRMDKEETRLAHEPHSIIETAKINYAHLVFGFHQSAVTLLNSISIHLDKILVFQLLGPQETAIYFIAMSLPNRLKDLIKQFEPYLFSKFAKHSAHSVQNQLPSRFLFALLCTVPVFIAYLVLVPFFFTYFLPQYQDATLLTQIYALTLFTVTAIIPQAMLRAHTNSATLYKIAGFYGVLRLGAVLVGILTLGLTGAILGATISALSFLAINYLYAGSISKQKTSSYPASSTPQNNPMESE